MTNQMPERIYVTCPPKDGDCIGTLCRLDGDTEYIRADLVQCDDKKIDEIKNRRW